MRPIVRCGLDLDDPLTRFVPGPWHGVLVRHLLSHSSGLAAGDVFVDTGNALLDAAGPLPGPAPEPAPTDLSPYAGRYVSHAGAVEITTTGDGLLARAEGLPGLPLTPRDRQTFDSPGGPVAFLGFDDHGTPTSLRWRMRVMRRPPR